MAVLLSYNEADSWTVANLVKATQIKEDLLVQASCPLRSLNCYVIDRQID
jgi:hypothetical protein